MYEIIRYFQSGRKKVIERGLTLKEAKEYCKDPETSSKTCTSFYKIKYTEKHGPWFDGYRQM